MKYNVTGFQLTKFQQTQTEEVKSQFQAEVCKQCKQPDPATTAIPKTRIDLRSASLHSLLLFETFGPMESVMVFLVKVFDSFELDVTGTTETVNSSSGFPAAPVNTFAMNRGLISDWK
jgi:hypothetical protein